MPDGTDLRKLIREDMQHCPTCGRRDGIIYDENGQAFCRRDGTIIPGMENYFRGMQKTRNSDTGELETGTGSPESVAMHDMGLATVIGKNNVDAHGGHIRGQMRSTLDRLRTWDRRSQVNKSVDRNLGQALSEMDRLAGKLNLPQSVQEKGAYIYRKALEKGLIRGRAITYMAAASLYAACRETETPRTLKDISAVMGGTYKTKNEIARSYRTMFREGIFEKAHGEALAQEEDKEQSRSTVPVPVPANYVSRVASEARLTEKTKRRALEMLEMPQVKEIMAGKEPMGFAAAALYLACTLEGENKTQKEVADAARVTEVTIRNRYKGLQSALYGKPEPESKDAFPERRDPVPKLEHPKIQDLPPNTRFMHQEMLNRLIATARTSGAPPEVLSKTVEIYDTTISEGINTYPNINFAVACLVSAYRVSGVSKSGANFNSKDVSPIMVNRNARMIEERLNLNIKLQD